MSSERRYRARTPGEALRHARAELGEEARLLAARRITPPGQSPLYEIRVMPGPAGRRDAEAPLDALRREVAALRDSVARLGAPPIAAEPPFGTATTDLPGASSTGGESDTLVTLLRRRGVGETLSRSLAARARESADGDDYARLRDVVTAALATSGPHERWGERSTVVVGPSGSGKTTTLAKIAADAVAGGARPVLVCSDGESLGGEDALAAVAQALSLPFETAFLDGMLGEVVERIGRRATYLVDTPGRTPDEPGAVESLRTLVSALPDPQVLVVAPLATEDEELRRLVVGFAPLGVEKVVLTKLDEIVRPGRLVELAQTLPRPVGWVTFGRSARGAGSTPDDPRVVARVLGTTLAVERTA